MAPIIALGDEKVEEPWRYAAATAKIKTGGKETISGGFRNFFREGQTRRKDITLIKRPESSILEKYSFLNHKFGHFFIFFGSKLFFWGGRGRSYGGIQQDRKGGEKSSFYGGIEREKTGTTVVREITPLRRPRHRKYCTERINCLESTVSSC